jgi:hypothetical protein
MAPKDRPKFANGIWRLGGSMGVQRPSQHDPSEFGSGGIKTRVGGMKAETERISVVFKPSKATIRITYCSGLNLPISTNPKGVSPFDRV